MREYSSMDDIIIKPITVNGLACTGVTVLWDSDTDPLPQDTTVAVAGTVETLYVITNLNWVASSGGSSSPFEVGTTPFLNEIGLRYKTEEI